MKLLRLGDEGSLVQLLQTALSRAGYLVAADGIFGRQTQNALLRFQRDAGIAADGIAGPQTNAALLPYYRGYILHTIRRGDTFYRIAMRYGSSIFAIETANPNVNPLRLQIGSTLVIPLDFPVVPTDIAVSSDLVNYAIRGLAARYPFFRVQQIGTSVLGSPIQSLCIGTGSNRVLYNASHHANEWITTLILLRFAEELAAAYAEDGAIFNISATELLETSTICLVPAVNPDGIDLVTGALPQSDVNAAAQLAANYPEIPFPSGWKANIRGIDTNLQYPAGWETAKEIKASQGYLLPGPRDYVGTAPLQAPESRSMYDYTRRFDPSLTLSYHTQGQVIYWQFLDYAPENARAIANRFSAVSGYSVEDTPYASSFAGYKDWFLQDFGRPGYTIEAGLGTNPLPIADFPAIYRDNLGILVLGALLTAGTAI